MKTDRRLFGFALACVSAVALRASGGEFALGDFTRGDGGWRAAHHMKDVEASAAGTSFTVTDNDPWFLGPKVAIPAAPGTAPARLERCPDAPSDKLGWSNVRWRWRLSWRAGSSPDAR